MIKVLAIFSLGLLATKGAYSEENGEYNYKRADKFIEVMSRAGIHSTALNRAAYFADERIDNNEFRITENRFSGYNLRLSHDIDFPDLDDMTLRIAPDKSNYILEGKRDKVMINYRVEIPVFW